MAEKDKKYYWLKLKRDFFKRHDIQIIEDMPNGKDYILFYLKLLAESVDHNGNLRFSEEIPYNEQMLSTITRTNVDVVRSAIKVFESLKMLEIMDDGTYFMNEVQKMLGSETYWAERKRIQKAKQEEQKALTSSVGNFPTSPSKSIEKEKDIDKELEKEKKNKKEKQFSIENEFSNSEVLASLNEFIKMRKLIKKPLTDFALHKICNKLKKFSDDPAIQIKILEQSILNNWLDIYQLKQQTNKNSKGSEYERLED